MGSVAHVRPSSDSDWFEKRTRINDLHGSNCSNSFQVKRHWTRSPLCAMLSEEIPIVLFDAKSLARSICVSRAWQRAGERKMRDMIAASILNQRTVRGALELSWAHLGPSFAHLFDDRLQKM